MIDNECNKDVPGPGSYSPCETRNNNQFKNGYDYRLHSYNRNIELHDKSKRDLPGPGQYLLPSDFGNVTSTMQSVVT